MMRRQISREWTLFKRQPQVVVNASLFFLMVLVFFPLSMPSDPNVLRTVSPGLVWIALLLAFLLSADRLFQEDYDDGVIEQWLVSGDPLTLYVGVKIGVYWIGHVIPILLLCPILAFLFSFNVNETLVLMGSICFGTPAMGSLCGLAAACNTGFLHKGMLMALMVLPLTLPLLILGSGTLAAAMQGLPISGYLAILLAMSMLSFSILPIAIAGVIRAG